MNADANECVAETIYPVAIGAEIPASWLDRLAMLAIEPTLFLGAIREGTDQATGHDAARPPSAKLIQKSASAALWG